MYNIKYIIPNKIRVNIILILYILYISYIRNTPISTKLYLTRIHRKSHKLATV